jgi:hypothetical protein
MSTALSACRRAAVTATCLLLLSTVAASAQDRHPVGQVVRQQGNATALFQGRPRLLHVGAQIFESDWIFTDSAAKVAVELADGSTVSVGPGSRVEIARYALDAENRGVGGTLTLILGIIRTALSDAWHGGFEVRARAAVASVRSTDWITQSGPDKTSVFVVDGSVAVRGSADGTTVTLGLGNGTDVETGGAPSPPKQWGAARVAEVLERTKVP